MAQKREVIITMQDDLDGSSRNVETVTFSIEGQSFEIDLGPKNQKAIRADFEKWSSHARKAKRTTGRATARKSAAKAPSEAAAIRAWASENGVSVPARGRIPAAVAEQYRAAS